MFHTLAFLISFEYFLQWDKKKWVIIVIFHDKLFWDVSYFTVRTSFLTIFSLFLFFFVAVVIYFSLLNENSVIKNYRTRSHALITGRIVFFF